MKNIFFGVLKELYYYNYFLVSGHTISVRYVDFQEKRIGKKMGMECSTDGNYEPHQVIIN